MAHTPFDPSYIFCLLLFIVSLPLLEHKLHENKILFRSQLNSYHVNGTRYAAGDQINICLVKKEGKKGGTLKLHFYFYF